MSVRRDYAGGAVRATLGSTITNSSMTITLDAGVGATGWPLGSNGPFYVVIDRWTGTGTNNEEKVLVTSRSSLTLTVSARGVDGTTAVAHTAGVYVEHCGTAVDLDEANAFVNNPALVGTLVASAPGDTASAGTSETWARGDHRHARESAPISIPTFTARSAAAVSPATSTTPAAVAFDTELVDTHAGHSNTSNNSRYTIPAGWAGTWFFSGQVRWTANATGVRIVQLVVNGTTVWLETVYNAQATVTHGTSVSGLISGLVAGDHVEVWAAQNSGGGLAVVIANPSSPLFTGHWVHS